METELFNEGQRPAVSVGLSVSRVGSAAQIALMKQATGSMKLELANYREVKAFAQFGSDLDAATQHQLNTGARLVELLKQPQFVPMAIGSQIFIMFAGSQNVLNVLGLDQISSFEDEVASVIGDQFSYLLNLRKAKSKLSSEELMGFVGACRVIIKNRLGL